MSYTKAFSHDVHVAKAHEISCDCMRYNYDDVAKALDDAFRAGELSLRHLHADGCATELSDDNSCSCRGRYLQLKEELAKLADERLKFAALVHAQLAATQGLIDTAVAIALDKERRFRDAGS